MNLVVLINGAITGLQFEGELGCRLFKELVNHGRENNMCEVKTIAGNTIYIRPSSVDAYGDGLEAFN